MQARGRLRARNARNRVQEDSYVTAAAKFIDRHLPEPDETNLGGEGAHELLAATHANLVCPPSGHSISWDDCYASADQLPLHHKAGLLLERNGEPRTLPPRLTPEEREQARQACSTAAWIRREAHRRGISWPWGAIAH